jgi:hypothetical protein
MEWRASDEAFLHQALLDGGSSLSQAREVIRLGKKLYAIDPDLEAYGDRVMRTSDADLYACIVRVHATVTTGDDCLRNSRCERFLACAQVGLLKRGKR